jgi:lysophospholipase L1-like esterase
MVHGTNAQARNRHGRNFFRIVPTSWQCAHPDAKAASIRGGEAWFMKREHVLSLLVLVVSLAVCALGIELFVRTFIDDGMHLDLEMWKYARDVKVISDDRLVGHAHRPNSQERLMGVDVKINSKGLRDREIPYERTGSTPRILMLGDSFTEGWGVPFEQTFSKRIERLYAARGTRAEVINTGVGNYNTIMEVQYFLNEGYKYKPDIVVLNFIPNDAEPVPPHAAPNVAMRNCHSCVFVIGRVDTLLRELSVRSDWETYYRNLYDNGRAKGWVDARTAIGKLAEYCKAHDIKLLVAHLPDLHGFEPYHLQTVVDLLHQTAKENAVDFVDLTPDFKGQDPAKLWVSPTDAHPNGLGNEIIANALFRKLETMK